MIRVISSTNISTQNKKYKENQKFINYHNLTFQGISVKSAEEYKDDDTLVGKYLKQAIASMKETFSKGEEVKPQTVEEIRNQFENKRVTIKKKIFVILKRKKIKNLTKQEVEKIEKFLEEKQKKLEMQE